MKKLNKLAQLYYSLASSQKPSYEEYCRAWDELLKTGYPDFTGFIRKWYEFLQKEPESVKTLFKEALEYDDSVGGLATDVFLHAHKVINTSKELMPSALPIIKNTIIEFIEDRPSLLKMPDLIKFEDIFDKSEIQNFIINKIKTWSANQDDPQLHIKIRNLLKIFLKSSKVNKDVLLRMIRQIDPETFSFYYEHGPDATNDTRISDEGHWLFKQNFFKQDKYTLDDVIWLINDIKQPRTYTWKNTGIEYFHFNHVATRATPVGQALLRRALFRISKNNYFILDEQMQPMGAEYQTINVNSSEVVTIVQGYLTPQMKEKWLKIFDDFNIIPLEGIF